MKPKPISFRFTLLATFLGNTFEWYDHAAFGFLLPLIATLFFPPEHHLLAISFSMLAFALGSVLRPVGGFIFGYIGDRYGRRISLLLTIFLITVPVFILGVLPTYVEIGIAAPIILLVMRLIQGISVGGEFPGVVTYLYEASPPKKRPFYTSFVFFGVACGLFLGGTDFYFLSHHLTPEQLHAWGWRSVFIFGALLGVVTFFLRRKLHETAIFNKMHEQHETLRDPIRTLFRQHRKSLLQLVGIEVLETVAYNLIIPFSIIYLTEFMHLSFDDSLHWGLVRILTLIAAIPLAGYIASKIGPRRHAILAAWAFLLFSLPCYLLVQHEAFRFVGVVGLAVMLGFYMAPIATMYCGFFPANVRFSGVGIGFNMTIAVLGGFIPLISFVMIRHTGNVLIPAFFLMGSALVSLLTLRKIKSHSDEGSRVG